MLAGSDSGIARTENEDCCGIFEEQGLAIVCDGMGGHVAGASASRLAVTTIRYMYLFLDPAIHYQITKDLIARDLNIACRLTGAIRLTNRNIYKKSLQESELHGMGTTVSAIAIHHNIAVIAHVGDSRIYRIRQGTMKLLTEDHTWINELIQDQEIDREAAKRFEKKNVITRALGLNETIKIDIGIDPVESGDLYLICTDGLTNALSDEEIKRIILFNNENLDHSLRHLIDTAMMKDGSDNITVVLVAIEGLESATTTYQPAYFTLKAENKQITLLEDKFLKRELYNRNDSTSSKNSLTTIFKRRYKKLTLFAAIVILLVFVVVYAFSTHQSKKKSNQIAVFPNSTLSKISDNVNKAAIDRNLKNEDPTKSSLQIESKALPDSVANKIITASFENKEYTTQVSNIQSRSLKKNIYDRGKVFLTGLEKIRNNSNASLFINNKYWGKTEDVLNRGLSLTPGTYTISLRDSTDKILFQIPNITISAGDVKAIEIKGK